MTEEEAEDLGAEAGYNARHGGGGDVEALIALVRENERMKSALRQIGGLDPWQRPELGHTALARLVLGVIPQRGFERTGRDYADD